MNHPNIILLTIDCLRYDRCGFNGHSQNTTPRLDRLAQEATIFDKAVAPGPRTSESIPGILGGLLSADCMFYDELAYKAIPSNAPTVATWLRDQGYQTSAVVSNPQLSPLRNFDRGFEKFENLRIEDESYQSETEDDSDTHRVRSVVKHLTSVRGRFREPIRERIRSNTGRLLDPASIVFILERMFRQRHGWPTVPAEDVITKLLSALDTSDGSKPVFAWSHLNDLHAPLHPQRVREGKLLGTPSNLTQYRWDLKRIANEWEPNYAAMYECVLRYVDAQIGRLIEYLQANGMWDETILIITADHGEALHDRGVYGHASGRDRYTYDTTRDYMYEELLHVPLLVRRPSQDGSRIQSPISLIWLHELIAEVANLEHGDFAQQSERESHLNPDKDTIVISDAISTEGHTITTRQGHLKRISQCLGNKRKPCNDESLVFNLESDPGERIDISDTQETQMLDEVTERIFTNPDTLRPLKGKIDAETKELLEQLGYQ